VLVDEKFFPTPLSIGKRVATLLFGGAPERLFLAPAFYEQLLPSVGRILLGFFLGSFVGLLIGLVIGANRVLGDYVNPIVDYMRAIPATASLPIFILLLGGEDTMRVAFIAWGLSWYVLVNTAVGVANLDRTMLDMAKSFRISRLRLPVQVMIPAALPKTFAGLRVSLTAAVLLSVVSEFFLATNGIGFQMIQAQRRINVLDMWSWMVILALLGYVLNTALDLTESRVLKWHRQSHR
jgi:ABC-type nitrate/sulfonate/bicarbonate transport system permease component